MLNKHSLISFPLQNFCFLFLMTFLSDFAQAQKTKLYFDIGEPGGWVPFRTGAEAGQPGVLSELAQLMTAHSDIEFIPVPLPAKRAQKALKDGWVDFDLICLEWLSKEQQSEEYVNSEPLFEITENLITLAPNQYLFPSRESIFGKHVGTIAGYFYFDDNTFTRVDFLNESQLLQGLKHERFNVIILERETAKYWANLNKVNIAFSAVHSSGNLLIRLREEHQHLMPAINKTIQLIKNSGELQAILDKHKVESKIYYPSYDLN
ncbi:MAG: transporter substrate-binding domain-containing protein [Paraglaciecola sp.]|uniref:substrate-binding periplasmic protein n=3 Tax=Paraglaciecola sp. TaxID=1920173 RepID=UPI003298A267